MAATRQNLFTHFPVLALSKENLSFGFRTKPNSSMSEQPQKWLEAIQRYAIGSEKTKRLINLCSFAADHGFVFCKW